MNIEDIKKEIIQQYESHVIDYMNEAGIDKIENYIESFLIKIDFQSKINKNYKNNILNFFNTEEIKQILYTYENL